MKSAEERVKRLLIEQLGVDEDQITAESHLIDNLGADSLDLVEIVMALEEEFEIDIPDAEDENLLTVQQIVDYVSARVNPAGVHGPP